MREVVVMFPSKVKKEISKVLEIPDIELEFIKFAETDYSLLWEISKSDYLLKKSIFSFNDNEGDISLYISKISDVIPKIHTLSDGYFLQKRILSNNSNTPEEIEKTFERYTDLQIDVIGKDHSSLPLLTLNEVEMGSKTLTSESFVTEKFSEDDLDKIRVKVNQLISKINKFDIPNTLEHGDLHLGNYIENGDVKGFFIDWSEAKITHPFLSLSHIVFSLSGMFDGKKINIDIEAVEEKYLKKWTKYGSINELTELLSLIKILSPYYYCNQYYNNYLKLDGPIKEQNRQDVLMLLNVFYQGVQNEI
ncbi:MAG: hypothetical protein KC493_07220 [Bacteriovoracaceae bacterium]|nr:hypothetical protein [Bacteriovoracaceae bacterium]